MSHLGYAKILMSRMNDEGTIFILKGHITSIKEARGQRSSASLQSERVAHTNMSKYGIERERRVYFYSKNR